MPECIKCTTLENSNHNNDCECNSENRCNECPNCNCVLILMKMVVVYLNQNTLPKNVKIKQISKNHLQKKIILVEILFTRKMKKK